MTAAGYGDAAAGGVGGMMMKGNGMSGAGRRRRTKGRRRGPFLVHVPKHTTIRQMTR